VHNRSMWDHATHPGNTVQRTNAAIVSGVLTLQEWSIGGQVLLLRR
jgi:hypothetical protein